MNSTQRKRYYAELMVIQGGEYCRNCLIDIPALKKAGKDPILCIDHIDNNSSNNQIDNLQLLCRSCNTRKDHTEIHSDQLENAPIEYQISMKNEAIFRRYIVNRFIENPNMPIRFSEIKASAAEYTGCSMEAARNYLKKMTSREGNYKLMLRNGALYLVMTDPSE